MKKKTVFLNLFKIYINLIIVFLFLKASFCYKDDHYSEFSLALCKQLEKIKKFNLIFFKKFILLFLARILF